jgi:hypothetical protein
MPGRVITLLASLAVASIFVSSARAQTAGGAHRIQTYSGSEIPARLTVGSAFIFQNSDTLILSGRLLQAGVDYHFVSGAGYFDLSAIAFADNDTLVARYRAVPAWLSESYGRPLPDIATATSTVEMPTPVQANAAVGRLSGRQMVLTGSKTFRFSSRTSGGSDFGQSLDMHISGEISPGLTLTGTVSDRGYNPAYGTANSRLSELDKVNLQLSSRRLLAQIGDIEVGAFQSSQRKTVSGASVDLTYPSWNVHTAAARPRGLYASYAFTGADGFQGPYQIGDGARARPVVPGSETVWLDGRRMERGAGKDYTIDYPSGRITFMVLWPIDSRSRIEVDYEPQATTFKGELYAAGGGGHLSDSLVYIGVSAIREGDDKSQPLAGELSSSDRALLEMAGDSPVTKSGATADTLGDYILILDSLPDTVFQYVAKPNGEYRITFSYVGSGNGTYRFLGGDNYVYVGSGRGDYSPVTFLPTATRTDYYRAGIGSRSTLIGDLSLDLRASSHDANLWSALDDSDNDAMFYAASWQRLWQWHGAGNRLSASRRHREARYVDRERINTPDFARRFLLPRQFGTTANETLHETDMTISPLDSLIVTGSFDVLDYKNIFDSRNGAIGLRYRPVPWMDMEAETKTLAGNLKGALLSGDGEMTSVKGAVTFRPLTTWRLGTTFERDKRRNEYYSRPQGTAYDQYLVTLERLRSTGDVVTEGVSYQRYLEDTLTSDWTRSIIRDRVSVSSTRQIGRLSYDATVTNQWLQRMDGNQRSLLGRAGLNYYSARNRLGVSAAYAISDERRNARGVTYLEVDPGMGNFVFQDGQYIPDPDGNYIEVEQLLSDTARVRRGEKSFSIDKGWSFGTLRLASETQEELKDGGRRNLWWILPFVADPDQPCLFFSRRYTGEGHVFPLRQGAFAVNVQAGQFIEKREVASQSRQRKDENVRLWLKQPAGPYIFEQTMELFRFDRDSLYSGSGDVSGYRLNIGLRRTIAIGEANIAAGYRRADSKQGAQSQLVSVEAGSRTKLWDKGEMRTSAELYTQTLEEVTALTSYQLTGNHNGTRGVLWSLSINYGLKGQVRMNVSLNGRHSDDHPGRVTGRGEVVAGF